MDNLRFVEVVPDEPRKTAIYSVHTTHVLAGGLGTHQNNVLSHIGEIRWHGGWRQYVNWPDKDTCWSWECLSELSIFIKGLMDKRKEKKREVIPIVDEVPPMDANKKTWENFYKKQKEEDK